MSTPFITDCVPNWCRMPYNTTSSGRPIFSRSRRTRWANESFFHGVPRAVRKTNSVPTDWRRRIRISIFTTSDTKGMTRGFGVRWVRIVLCCRNTMTALSRSTSAHFSFAISLGRAPVKRRKNRTCRKRSPGVGRCRGFRRIWPGVIVTVALINPLNSSSVSGRRGWPGRWLTPWKGLAAINRWWEAQLKGRCTTLTMPWSVQSVCHSSCWSSQWVRWIGLQSHTGRQPWLSANRCKYRWHLSYVRAAFVRLTWAR